MDCVDCSRDAKDQNEWKVVAVHAEITKQIEEHLHSKIKPLKVILSKTRTGINLSSTPLNDTLAHNAYSQPHYRLSSNVL